MRLATTGYVAGVCALAIACSPIPDPNASNQKDAPEADGPAVDGDPHGTVTATVLDVLGNGAPESNVPVVFQNPDGSVVANVKSDSSGRVSASGVLPGASLTVVWEDASRYTVLTIRDIKPGDDIRLGFDDRDHTVLGTFDVTFPPYESSAASSYTVYGPCNSVGGTPNTTVKISFYKDCHPDTFDVYVAANSSGGNMFRTAQVVGVNKADGQATITGSWTPVYSFYPGVTNLPDGVSSVSVTRRAASPQGQQANNSTTVLDNMASLYISPAPLAGSSAYVATEYSTPSDTQHIIQQKISPSTPYYQLDAGSMQLGEFTKHEFDVATHTFTMTVDHANQDVAAYDVQYQNAAVGKQVEWIVFAADVPATFQLPTLPGELADLLPAATDALGSSAYFLIEDDRYTTWDEARAHLFSLFDDSIRGHSDANLARASLNFGF